MRAGGGGGAGSTGEKGIGGTNAATSTSGTGGAGVMYDISGEEKWYGGGGGGGGSTANLTVAGGKGGGGGTVNLGYGIYEGPTKGGKANGIGGTIRFTRTYSIDLKKATGETVEVNAGDRMINVKMENNRIIQGQLKRADGSQKWIIIG